MIWVLFIMHLASHGTQAEETMQFVPHCDHTEVSDSQPISSQLNTVERSTECLASCEIKPVSVDSDNENIDEYLKIIHTECKYIFIPIVFCFRWLFAASS